MFGMGFTEILMIAVVAILFLGPDKLPEAMVQIGKFINSFRKTINEAKSTFEEEINIRELREEALSYRQTLQQASSDISGFKHSLPNPAKEVREAFESVKLEDSPELWDDDEFEELGEEHEAIIEKKKEVVGSPPAPSKREENPTISGDTGKAETADERLTKKEKTPRPRGFKNLAGGTPS